MQDFYVHVIWTLLPAIKVEVMVEAEAEAEMLLPLVPSGSLQ